MKAQTTKTKNLVMLSLIALSFLSATLLNVKPDTKEKEHSEKVSETISRLKKFEVKDYLKEYEHKKRAKEMLDSSLKRAMK